MLQGSLTPEYLSEKVWRFERGSGQVLAKRIQLRSDGTIEGHRHDNETRWVFSKDALLFVDINGEVSTAFTRMSTHQGLGSSKRLSFRGFFRNTDSEHVLRELDAVDERIEDGANTVVNLIASKLLGQNDDCFDLVRIASLIGSVESANYFSKSMRKARLFVNREELLDYACSLVSIDGLCLEFGVASGRTITQIAGALKREVFGFDCFTGLPEVWRPGFEAGAFSQGMPNVPEQVHLIPGLFADTLPGFRESHPGPVSFMHVDCDLYSSADIVFRIFASGLQEGTIIVFDEYINYPGWQLDEFRAFQEFVLRERRSYDYVGLVADHQQVCVRING